MPFPLCISVRLLIFPCVWIVNCLCYKSHSYLCTLVAARLAEIKVFKIMGHSVEVALFTGTVEDDTHSNPTSRVSDNVLILSNVPGSMSDGMLMLYIDNITELDGEQKDYSIDRNDAEVVVTFNAALDVHKFPGGKYCV